MLIVGAGPAGATAGRGLAPAGTPVHLLDRDCRRRLILDLAIGRRPYLDVRRRIFARAPLLAARFVIEELKFSAVV